MKLHELKQLKESKRELIIHKWDGNDPAGCYIKPFDVLVTYDVQDLGYSYHPYGEGTAREDHGLSVTVLSITTVHPVDLLDDSTMEVLKVLPAGTDLERVPGWTPKSMAYFQEKVEEASHEAR